jgi:hypothetical protein
MPPSKKFLMKKLLLVSFVFVFDLVMMAIDARSPPELRSGLWMIVLLGLSLLSLMGTCVFQALLAHEQRMDKLEAELARLRSLLPSTESVHSV